MKVLTLTQPWASLVALDEKRIETRSWYSSYRGPLAIHAAMGFPGWAKRECFVPPFSTVLVRHGLSPDNLPLGRILCITTLEYCIETQSMDLAALQPLEAALGDYSRGRFAWVLGPVTRVFEPPIYARGSLGLWNWKEPDPQPPTPSPEEKHAD